MIVPPRFRADPGRTLARQLAELFGAEVRLVEDEPWASLTLDGRRHRLLVSDITRPAFAEDLPEHEFDIPGHIVASAAVAERHRIGAGEALVVDALTVKAD